MNIEIYAEPKTLTLYGFSKIHDENKKYSEEIFELLDKVWTEVRDKKMVHLGINHVVYDCNNVVFAGVELKTSDGSEISLEKKCVTLQKYAYWKHVGSYNQFEVVYNNIHSAIKVLGLTTSCPNMEIYGHWSDDESKLETEIFISVE